MSPSITRTVDPDGRIVLPPEFIGKKVTVKVIGESGTNLPREKLEARPSFSELMSRVTDENLPEKVDLGHPVGGEEL